MAGPPELHPILCAHLGDRTSSWSIGDWGAIAEFHWLPDDPAATTTDAGLQVATPGGALRLRLRDDVVPYAYQTLSRFPDRWLHGVTLCLPWRRARRAARQVLTELGPDRDAVRPADRGKLLFDLGLGLPTVDACVRTDEPALVAALRRGGGQSLLARGNPAMAAIKDASPHRVFTSALGRLEVYQPIGHPDAHPRTPEGPHTHVLPNLLGARRPRTGAGDAPAYHRACVTLYPAHPLLDGLGRRRPYDADAHARFDGLLDTWGDPAFVAEKRRASEAMDRGLTPEGFRPPTDRRGRQALRVAVRELAQRGGETAIVLAWRRRFDPARAPRRPHGAH